MASSLARRLDPYATIELGPSPRGKDKLPAEPSIEAEQAAISSINLADYTAAGYYLSRRIATDECAGIDLGRVSLASDRRERAFFPDSWCLSWVRKDREERIARAAAFGFGADQIDSLMQWANRSFGSTFGFWRVFFSIDDARSVGQSALGGDSGVELWGAGLHRSLVDGYCRAPGQISASGVRTAIYAGKKLAEGGSILGYDLLFEELGSSFSSPETRGLDEVAMFRSTGVAPNEDGLIDSLPDARKCCRYLDERAAPNRQPVKGWQPWLLVRYPMF
jgi:hypothetical protein